MQVQKPNLCIVSMFSLYDCDKRPQAKNDWKRYRKIMTLGILFYYFVFHLIAYSSPRLDLSPYPNTDCAVNGRFLPIYTTLASWYRVLFRVPSLGNDGTCRLSFSLLLQNAMDKMGWSQLYSQSVASQTVNFVYYFYIITLKYKLNLSVIDKIKICCGQYFCINKHKIDLLCLLYFDCLVTFIICHACIP